MSGDHHKPRTVGASVGVPQEASAKDRWPLGRKIVWRVGLNPQNDFLLPTGVSGKATYFSSFNLLTLAAW